jgi:hypothetical protein
MYQIDNFFIWTLILLSKNYIFRHFFPCNVKEEKNMDPFFTYTAILAGIILILILVAFGIMMSKVKSSDAYPPTFNACPDNYKIDSSGNCLFPIANGVNRGDVSVDGDIIKSDNPWHTVLVKTLGTNASGGTAATPSSLELNNPALWANTTTMKAYNGLPIRCAQKKWADGLGIVWDGITNYNGC